MKTKVYFSDETGYLKELEPLNLEYNPNAEWRTLNIHPELKYQKIFGFGGAFTESSAVNYDKMSDENKQKVMELFFDKEKGLGYNFCRSTINSCDFSVDEYTYIKDNDTTLESFDISRDKQAVIPMIKDAVNTAGEIFLFSSPWSPPAWMKDSNEMLHGGKLKKELYSVWANYFVKFIKEYEKAGVKVSGVTVQNEPLATQTWESCVYTIDEQIVFARDFLKPAFKEAGLDDVKIMIWDHNKEHVFECAKAIKETEGAFDCIDGIAFHWYSGKHFEQLSYAHEICPQKFLVASEFCLGFLKTSFEDALRYATDMSGNFNNFMEATCDWNLILDENGGPYHARRSGCKAVIHYNTKEDKIEIMPHYYAVKHFSGFVKKDAVRLGTSSCDTDILISAFKNESGETVAVITSNSAKENNCILRYGDYASNITVKPKSITTIVIED